MDTEKASNERSGLVSQSIHRHLAAACRTAPLVIFSLLCCLAVPAQHKYYFARGSGDGKGTRHEPWHSLALLWQVRLQPGDSVFLRGGDTLSGPLVIDSIHGAFRKNIVLCSYGKGTATITGDTHEALVAVGADYLTMEGLRLAGAGRKTGNTTDGLKCVECSHATFRNIEISGFQKSGMMLYNCRSIEADGVISHDNGQAGITVEGSYQQRLSRELHFINCRTDNNPGDPTNLTNHSGNGLVVGNCRNVLIEYCTATNNGWDMPRIGNGPVGIWAYEADSVIIQHCISYRNKTAKGAADGGGFDLDGGVTNSVIQYCLSFENWGTGYGIYQYWSASRWHNNTVRYCVSINDGNVTELASAMHIWNGRNGDSTFTDCFVYNNFFYNGAKYALSFNPLGQHRAFRFFNNVFVAADSADLIDGSDSSKNDLFLSNLWMNRGGGFRQNGFTDLAAWARATGFEMFQGKFYGLGSSRPAVSIPETINLTNPRELASSSLLRSLCIGAGTGPGIDLLRMFSIHPGERDFFGKPLAPGTGSRPGICQAK